MFENLSERLERAFKNFKGQGAISEVNVAETVKDIRRSLLEADVNFKIAKEFTNNVKEKALGQKVLTSVSPGQLMVKITQDELALLMGSEKSDLEIDGNPAVIMVAGLQGAGKTTFCGKLALHLKNQKKNPLLVACDIYRPAAIKQLQTLGEQIDVPVYAEEDNKKVEKIAKAAIQEAKQSNANVVIIDTAGRLAIDEDMMKEIEGLKKSVKPKETLFVVDSMIGQDAVQTAKAFNDVLDLSGVVLTKLDGDTRGGAALSIKAELNKPIKFISNGEKLENIEVFHPDRIASRILGAGDIVTFVEKIQQDYDEKKEQALKKKIKQSKLDFNDFKEQINKLKKMGSMKDLMGMIPGARNLIQNKNIDFLNKKFDGIEVIINSMTPKERENPDLLNSQRKSRIAKGAGKDIGEINNMVKEFDKMRKMMKKMSKNDFSRLPF